MSRRGLVIELWLSAVAAASRSYTPGTRQVQVIKSPEGVSEKARAHEWMGAQYEK